MSIKFYNEKENKIMGLLCKPTGKMKRIMKKLENEQMKEKQAMKNKKKEK